MLTGDRQETAVNVAFSCDLIDSGTQLFKIDQGTKKDTMNYLTMVLKNIQKHEKKRKQALKEKRSYPEYATIVTGDCFYKI